MSWLIAIVAGALVGWIVSAASTGRHNLFVDMIVGMIGAALSRWLFGTGLNIGSGSSTAVFDLLGLVWGVVGSLVVLGLVRAFSMSGEQTSKMGPAYYEEIKQKKDSYRDEDKREKN